MITLISAYDINGETVWLNPIDIKLIRIHHEPEYNERERIVMVTNDNEVYTRKTMPTQFSLAQPIE